MWIADSYAKISLGLHVLERLPTGYHRIETGFCFIEWRDRFEVQKADSWSLTLSDESIPAGESNLITRAYETFTTYVGLKSSYRLKVTKSIPAGAGHGGARRHSALTMRTRDQLE